MKLFKFSYHWNRISDPNFQFKRSVIYFNQSLQTHSLSKYWTTKSATNKIEAQAKEQTRSWRSVAHLVYNGTTRRSLSVVTVSGNCFASSFSFSFGSVFDLSITRFFAMSLSWLPYLEYQISCLFGCLIIDWFLPTFCHIFPWIWNFKYSYKFNHGLVIHI